MRRTHDSGPQHGSLVTRPVKVETTVGRSPGTVLRRWWSSDLLQNVVDVSILRRGTF